MLLTVKTKTPPPVISVPSGFATLEDVTDSFYVYRVSYIVDATEAIKNKTFIVKINVDKNTGNQSVKPVLVKNTSIQQMITNIRLQAPMVKAAAISKPPYVLTYTSDITSKIPNSSVSKITAAAAGVMVASNKLSSTVTTLVTRAASQVNLAGFKSPLMDLNLNAAKTNPIVTINPQLTKIQSTKLLFSGIDPASLTKTSNTIVPTSKTYSGTIPKISFTQTAVIKNNPIAMNIVASQLSNIKSTTVAKLAPQQAIVTVVKNTTSLITIHEKLYIPITQIGKNNFNIVFDLLAPNSIIHQSVKAFVEHGINLTKLIPTTPPGVKQLSNGTMGRAVFEVKQFDQYAKGFFVYRRELSPNKQIRNAKYTQVAKQNLMPGETFIFEDRINTINKVLYRFIPFADEDLPSSVFTSSIVSFKNNSISSKNSLNRRPVHAVLNTRMSEKNNYIDISVSNYSESAISMRLRRRNLSIHQSNFAIIATSPITHTTAAGIKFIDNDVKSGNIYEYKVDLVFPDGHDATVPTSSIIEYSPVTNNIAVTKVSNITSTSYEGLADITFDIEYSLSETNFELIKKLFSEQKLTLEYQTEIIRNKSKLTTLLAYKVLRTNLTTGEVENFGIISDKKFSDRKFGLSRSVKNLDSSSEYYYTVITYVRNPETVLPNYVRTVGTTSDGVKSSYSLQPYKWYQPVTLAEGSIVTSRTLQANHSKSELEQGMVVDIRYIPVAVSNILPTIESALASKIKEDTVYIEWKVIGDLEKIDHFIVILDIMGMKTIIGTAHAISTNRSFAFVDPLTNGEKGQLEYTIVPVYYDYERGKSFKTNTVII